MIQWKLGFEVAAVVCQSRLSLQMFAPPSDDLWPQEFLGSDAAPDELKTLRLNTQLQWFRNARIRVRDAAHAAGRFLTQIEPLVLFWNLISQSSCQLKLIFYNFPNLRLTQKWNKIPMLKEVWYKYCWSSNSIYQPHPPQPSECADFQEIWALASLGLVFEQELEWMTVREFPYAMKLSTDKVKEDSKRTWKTRNLCFAKHRHSSMLKPASRFVLHTSAIIHAAMETLVIASVTISHFNWFVVIDPGIEWPNLSQIQGSTQGEQRPSPRRMLSRFCFPSMRKPYFKWRWCVTQHKRSLTCHFAWLTDLILLWLSICTVSFWFSCGKVAWSTLWGSGSVTRTPWTCLKCELQWMVSWTESTPCFSNRKLFRFNPTHDMSLDGK